MKGKTPVMQKETKLTWAEHFTLMFPIFVDLLVKINDILLIIFRTLMVTGGVPVVIGAIMYVETPRVAHGIELFEADAQFAFTSAFILILVNKLMEVLIVYELSKSPDWIPDTRYVISIRVILGRFWRFLFGKQERSPASRYEAVSSLVTFAILSLAISGSMREAMSTYSDVVWYQGIWMIITRSNLLQLLTWIGGGLFAYTLVMADQSLAHYIAVYVTERLAEFRDDATQIEENIISVATGTEDPRITKTQEGEFIVISDIDGWSKQYSNYSTALSGLKSHDNFVSKKMRAEKKPS